MINFDDVIKENIEHNPNWPQISDHPYRMDLESLIHYLI